MPDPEVTPAADTTAKTPFAAKLEEAFKAQEVQAAEPKPEPAKEPAKAKEPAPEPKSTTPRDLFKKPEAKAAESEPARVEPKSALDEIIAPEFKDEKGKKGWDALKTEAKRWETEAQQLKREAEERKASGRDSESLEAKLAEAQKTLKEYDEIVSRARLDDHPAFRKEFVDGRQKIVDRAKSIIEESDGDAKAIETALNLKGKARAEALREASANLDSFQAARLGRAIDELNDLDERAQAKRDAAKKSYDEIREQERQREIEEGASRSKKRSVEFSEVSRRLTDGLEVLKKVDGFDDWNARADRILKESREYVDANPGADIEAEILSRAVPAYRDLFLESDSAREAAEAKAAKLEAELKAIHGKNPSLAARAASQSGGKTDSKRPFSEALSQALSGA